MPSFQATAYVSHMLRSLPAGELIETIRREIDIAHSTFPALRLEHLEIVFVRFLHLLAHHPDFATSLDCLRDIAR
jgi:hypothetical protein